VTAFPTPTLGVTAEEVEGEWWGALWLGGSRAFEFRLDMPYYDTQARAYEDACDHVAAFLGRLYAMDRDRD